MLWYVQSKAAAARQRRLSPFNVQMEDSYYILLSKRVDRDLPSWSWATIYAFEHENADLLHTEITREELKEERSAWQSIFKRIPTSDLRGPGTFIRFLISNFNYMRLYLHEYKKNETLSI